MLQTCIILQGPSGSGKSSLSRVIQAGADADYRRLAKGEGHKPCFICSTDDFFLNEAGVYVFKKERLGEYHAKNQAKARLLLKEGQSVIVDNTCIHKYEAKPYVQAAVDASVPVVFIRMAGQWKNEHGVPEQVVARMRAEMEPLTVEGCLAARAPWEKS